MNLSILTKAQLIQLVQHRQQDNAQLSELVQRQEQALKTLNRNFNAAYNTLISNERAERRTETTLDWYGKHTVELRREIDKLIKETVTSKKEGKALRKKLRKVIEKSEKGRAVNLVKKAAKKAQYKVYLKEYLDKAKAKIESGINPDLACASVRKTIVEKCQVELGHAPKDILAREIFAPYHKW